jgi:hypothetical protein
VFVFTTLSLFLGGLAAAAVPVVFHFLMQGKPKQITFPALMFISQHIETHRRKLQLKQILLLTLRILIVVLLGFALARPLLKLGDFLPNLAFSSPNGGFVSSLATSLGSQDAPVAAAIVIDNSLRMEYVAENKTRLDAAKKFAAWILDQLPQNSSVAVLSCGSDTNVFQVDKLAAAEKISRLQSTAVGKPVCEAVKNAAALLQSSELEERELYVITDLSEPGWTAGSAENTLPAAGFGVFVVDVGVSEPVNAVIQKVTINPESAAAETPIRFNMTVSHTGPAASKSVELVLGSEGKETVRMTKTVDFPSGHSQKPLTMMLAGTKTGVYQGKLRFSAGDALPIDDQYWFSFAVEPMQQFLLLAQPPVRDSARYFRQALEVVPFAVETMPFSELPGLTPLELQKYNAVVLLDPPPLQPTVWKKLADYASAGYGVGVFLGTNADSLPSFNNPAATEVLGAKLVRQARNPDGELWLLPGLSPVFAPAYSLGDTTLPLSERLPWMTQTVFRYWHLNDLSPRSEIAATFSDQRPAILTQTLGRGHTVTVATPVSELSAELPDGKMLDGKTASGNTPPGKVPWNLWTRGEASWMFVLLSEGIARYLAGSAERKYNFPIGEPAMISLSSASAAPASCQLATPDGKSVSLTPDAGKRQIHIDSQEKTDIVIPGNYRIRSGGKSALDIGFSLNIPPGQTNLNKIDVKILDGHFGANNYRLVRTPQEIERSLARRRIGSEIYALLMLLLAAVFAAEYIFANRFYR